MEPLPPHGGWPVATLGPPPAEARGAVILVHGRGATAESILDLARVFDQPDLHYLAPQAAGNAWYPHSFLAPLEANEPGLSSGLSVLASLVDGLITGGMAAENIVLGGFSQGACLSAEFAARNARRFGGLLVLSGGLIGPPGTARDYPGDLAGTPALLGCSDVDMHIPLQRVEETAAVLEEMGAVVDTRIYPGMGHTVNNDEVKASALLLSGLGNDKAQSGPAKS